MRQGEVGIGLGEDRREGRIALRVEHLLEPELTLDRDRPVIE